MTDGNMGGDGAPIAAIEDDAVPTLDVGPEEILALVLFTALAGTMFLQVFTRYVLNSSLAWTEEIARYLLIAVAFIGAAAATRRGAHIAVEVVRLLPAGVVRGALLRLADLITFTFFAYATYIAVLTAQALRFQRMTVIDVSIAVLYAVVAFGLGLCTLRALQRIARDVTGRR
ncbi:MAG: TRAP transporter small permease [Acuticoccus sp.]